MGGEEDEDGGEEEKGVGGGGGGGVDGEIEGRVGEGLRLRLRGVLGVLVVLVVFGWACRDEALGAWKGGWRQGGKAGYVALPELFA